MQVVAEIMIATHKQVGLIRYLIGPLAACERCGFRDPFVSDTTANGDVVDDGDFAIELPVIN